MLTRKLLNQGFLVAKPKSPLRTFYSRHHDLGRVTEYLCHKWPRICAVFFPHSWRINGFVTSVTRQVPLVEQEPLTLPEHLRSPTIYRTHGARSLIFVWCFVDRCLFVCLFFPVFFLAIVLSVLFRFFTASEYLFQTFHMSNTACFI